MASESGQEKRETLADIVSEIRAYGAQPPPRLMWLEIADRIEAAWRRERSEIEANALAVGGVVEAARHKPGNAAAMREALIEIEKMAHIDLCNVYPKYRNKFNNLVGGIERIARAALSTPSRQCDVGTAEEQAVRFRDMCNKYYDDENPCNNDCPIASLDIIHGFPRCQAYWAQTPYEAQEGGAE